MRTPTLLLALLAISSQSFAATLPESPAGRCASALLAAISKGDDTTLKQFVAAKVAPEMLKRRSTDQVLAMLRQLHDDIGEHQIVSVEVGGPTELSFVLEPSDGAARFSFELRTEPAEPYRLLQIGVDARGGGEEGPPAQPAADDAAWITQTKQFVAHQVAERGFSGAVMIAHPGKLLWQGSFGLAQRNPDVAVTADTRFNVGSINKTFTQVAVAQLLAAKKLALGDTLARWVPEFSNKEAASKITVGQLLTHRSGLGDIFGPRFAQAVTRGLPTLSDVLKFYADEPLVFAPGSDRRYSNLGYVALGVIVERASGMPFGSYLEKNIFTPAGMKTAMAWATDPGAPGLARGYTAVDESKSNVLEQAPFAGRVYHPSAGASYMTAADLRSFAESLFGMKLLSPAWTAWLVSEAHDAMPTGAALGRDAGLGIAGGVPGHNADLEVDWARKAIVIVLANVDPPIAERTAQQILSSAPRN